MTRLLLLRVDDLGRAILHGAVKHGRDGRGAGGLAGYLETLPLRRKKPPKRKEATR